jgi:hypothetical protein
LNKLLDSPVSSTGQAQSRAEFILSAVEGLVRNDKKVIMTQSHAPGVRLKTCRNTVVGLILWAQDAFLVFVQSSNPPIHRPLTGDYFLQRIRFLL